MSRITLTHIVPAFAPQMDGIGDYALNLAQHLRQAHGIESRFIVCDPQWDGPSRVEEFGVRRLRIRTEAGIWSLLTSTKEQSAAVLLHYAGVGYHKLGVPLWLYLGIKSWLTEGANRHAGGIKQFSTVFHELWSSSEMPWEKDFYLGGLQRRLVQGFHHLSKLSVAGTRRMQALLEDLEPRKTLWLPMPSNMPSCERPKTGSHRPGPLRVAIFGQNSSRVASVRAHANLLGALQKKNLLGSAMLIGKGLKATGPATADLDLLQMCVGRERIEVMGELSPKEVAVSLGRADLFLSHHGGEQACKSGAFMAALAAGCTGVLRDGQNAVPLHESEHFIASDDSPASVERLERMRAQGEWHRIAAAGRLWYERHADWKVIAREYQEAMFQEGDRCEASAGSTQAAPEPVKAWTSRARPAASLIADLPPQKSPL
jgi:hypothetical protein